MKSMVFKKIAKTFKNLVEKVFALLYVLYTKD